MLFLKKRNIAKIKDIIKLKSVAKLLRDNTTVRVIKVAKIIILLNLKLKQRQVIGKKRIVRAVIPLSYELPK